MPRKKTRVAFLLVILAVVTWTLMLAREPAPPDWDRPLKVVIYPYNADGGSEVADFVESLTRDDFEPVARFMAEQAAAYRLPIEQPFSIELGSPIDDAPSAPPGGRGWLGRVRWGLSIRWWHFRFRDQVNKPDIIVIARYHDPTDLPARLHSIGIAAQRLAVAKLVADEAATAQNHLILAHEILHTVGASDLYHPETGQPRHPDGYAAPDQVPRHPQEHAEIMAGRIPLTPFSSRQPAGLEETVIGETTAAEIGWLARS